ncbi:hypothetical protein [Nibricoccus sp. IMCC34717]|uniref:hypothetical protein n=1 Tax=Nibricoccus sp. IMCC34717 TaxID=3034021 RepID=UPI00384D8F41
MNTRLYCLRAYRKYVGRFENHVAFVRFARRLQTSYGRWLPIGHCNDRGSYPAARAVARAAAQEMADARASAVAAYAFLASALAAGGAR